MLRISSNSCSKILLIGLSLILLVVVVGCQSRDEAQLSNRERAWLSERLGKLDILFGYQAPPNAYHDADGHYVGFLVDFHKTIEQRLDFRFANRDFDTWNGLIEYAKSNRDFVIVGIAETQARTEYLLFTEPFVEVPYVIITRQSSSVSGMADLSDLTVCTVANYAVNDFLALQYPDLDPQGVKDNLAGLQAVSSGSCDAMIVNQMYGSYLIESQGISNLRIVGDSGYLNKLSAAVSINDPELLPIIAHGIKQISASERRELYQRWVRAEGSYLPAYLLPLALAVLFVVLVSLLGFWLWTQSLRRQVASKTRDLVEREAHLRTLLDTLPDLVWMKDENGIYLNCNRKFETFFGATEEQIKGKSDQDFVGPEQAMRFREQDRIAINSQSSCVYEEEVSFASDGHKAVLETVNAPVYRPTGELLGVLGISRDITEHKHRETVLRESEQRFRAVFDQQFQFMAILSPLGIVIEVNDLVLKMQGVSREDYVGKPFWDAPAWRDYPEWYDIWQQRLQDAAAQRTPVLAEDIYQIEDGSIRHADSATTAFFNSNGQLEGYIVQASDTTERRKAEKAVLKSAESLRLLASVFENSAEGVLITDSEANIVEVNEAFTEILGYTRDEVIGRNPRFLQSGRQDQAFYQRLWKSLLETGRWRGEIWNRRKDGSLLPEWQHISSVKDENGQLTHYVSVFSDISQIKSSQEKLEHLAHHDALTDLPNRLLINERIEQSIRQAQRNGTQIALIFLDLDHFKHVNDSLGHIAGDQLLRSVSMKLKEAVRHNDSVARIGGDEFVLLLEDVKGADSLGSIAQKLLQLLSQPIQLEHQQIGITASLGICLFPQDGSTALELMRNADAAMYRAKEQGRDNYQFYTEEMTRNAFERMQLESSLRQALDNEELVLNYQPQLALATGEIIGVEALIRWQHPQLGQMMPAKFIAIAEDSGLIIPIGNWVIREACLQAKAWLDKGLDIGRVAVNVAGLQIQRGRLLDDVKQLLVETGLPPDHLELEITEGFIMQQAESAVQQLDQLRQLGVTLSIDDFGTGYSSLSYLKQLPVHKLKIDQSFVRDIPEDPDDVAIAKAIIAMGHSLGLLVIAEGVEMPEQAKILAEFGCQQAQGYLYGKPVSAEELEERLREEDGSVVITPS